MISNIIDESCGVLPETVILKFQRPLEGSAPEGTPDILVYDKARTIRGMINMTDEIAAHFGDGHKFYAACLADKDGTFSIRKVVGDQPW